MEIISVIIPIYNTEKYLRQTIESVLCQTYPHFEFLLINDGSTDGSLAICKEYQAKDERVRVISTDNHGVCHARNLGVSHAKGRYISFLDSDDLWEPDFLQRVYARMKESSEIKFVYSGSDERTPDGRILGKSISETEGYFDAFMHEKTGEFRLPFNMDSFLVEREVLTQYRIDFNPSYKISEDIGFFLKLLCVVKAYCTPAVLTHYVRRENSATTSVWQHRNWEGTVLLFDDARRYCEKHCKERLPSFRRMKLYRIYRYVLSVFQHGEIDVGIEYIAKYRSDLEEFARHGGKLGDRLKCRFLLMSNRCLLLLVYGKNR